MEHSPDNWARSSASQSVSQPTITCCKDRPSEIRGSMPGRLQAEFSEKLRTNTQLGVHKAHQQVTPWKKGEENGLRMDSCHNEDMTVSANPTGSLIQRCLMFPIKRAPHWAETDKSYIYHHHIQSLAGAIPRRTWPQLKSWSWPWLRGDEHGLNG